MSTSSMFGLNGIGYFHYRNAPDAAQVAQAKLNFFQQAGATWDRFDFWWDEIEPQQDQWKWDKADWIIDFYTRNHINMLPILCYSAAWMKESPHTSQDFADYADYVFHVVSRYKDRVHYWEIWNEPNIPTFWKPKPDPVAYTQLLKAAYIAAHKADPNCVVVGAAANETDINWLHDIAKHGGMPFMDAVSIHPYSMSDGPKEMYLARQLQNVKTFLRAQGRPNLPIWITEMGWISSVKDKAAMEAASRYMVQSYVIAAAEGIQRLFWFNLQDWMEGDKLEGWGLISPDMEAKTTLATYRNLVNKLEGARFVGYYQLPSAPFDYCAGYMFRRQDKDVMVIWANPNNTYPLPPLPLAVTDIYGHTVQRSRYRLAVSDSPIFIEGTTRAWRENMLLKILPDRPTPITKNLVINPSFGFMGGDRETPYGWHKGVFYGGADEGIFSIEELKKYKATDYVATLSSTKEAMWESWPVPAMPGERYTLTAKIKTVNATGENGVQILFLSGPGWGWRGGPTTKTITGTTDWQTVRVTGTVPEDADVVRVNLVSKNNSGKVLFNDIELIREADRTPTQ